MSAIFEEYVHGRTAKMTKRKTTAPKPEKPLDTFSKKRPRGRPRRVIPSETSGRARNYRGILNQVWDRLWPLLEQAQTEEAVTKAFKEGANPYAREFMPALAGLVLEVMRDRRFPERRDPQINFLADSLAGLGRVRPRRSRDICSEERTKEGPKSPHKIIRKEFYIECECGFKGPARDDACRRCGAEIPLSLNMLWAR
jgi:hypothetical protein